MVCLGGAFILGLAGLYGEQVFNVIPVGTSCLTALGPTSLPLDLCERNVPTALGSSVTVQRIWG
jgi:hypothetical protein